jgi:hypothetical protein
VLVLDPSSQSLGGAPIMVVVVRSSTRKLWWFGEILPDLSGGLR